MSLMANYFLYFLSQKGMLAGDDLFTFLSLVSFLLSIFIRFPMRFYITSSVHLPNLSISCSFPYLLFPSSLVHNSPLFLFPVFVFLVGTLMVQKLLGCVFFACHLSLLALFESFCGLVFGLFSSGRLFCINLEKAEWGVYFLFYMNPAPRLGGYRLGGKETFHEWKMHTFQLSGVLLCIVM